MNQPQAQFEIFKDTANQYRFRLRAPNNKTIATSESYTTKDACKDTIDAVRKYAPTAVLQDLT